MRVYFSQTHADHDPSGFLRSGQKQPSPECPERAHRLSAALSAAGYALDTPRPHGAEAIAAVHDAGYLDFLRNGVTAWRELPGASEEIFPNVHPSRHAGALPKGIVGRAGYYMADSACPVNAGTFAAAASAADAALSAAEDVLGGEPHAYALCRPPGHHAYADMAGGFCFLNNVAIAAQAAVAAGRRPAVLDVDVHHGNGTQGIFYGRGDVFFCSLHGDPSGFYPFYAGYADERGAGAGEGCNLNLPLPAGTGDEAFLEALQSGLAGIERFGADVLLVSLGLDAQENDPLGILSITTDGFARIAEAAAGLGLPTVIVQEGGYLCDELGANLVSFLNAFAGAHKPS